MKRPWPSTRVRSTRPNQAFLSRLRNRHMRQSTGLVFCAFVLVTMVSADRLWAQPASDPPFSNLKTVAESSEFRSTSLEKDVESFLKALDASPTPSFRRSEPPAKEDRCTRWSFPKTRQHSSCLFLRVTRVSSSLSLPTFIVENAMAKKACWRCCEIR